MTAETEDQNAGSSDEVSHEEYAAWEKGEEVAESQAVTEGDAEPFVEVTSEQDAGLEPVEGEPAGGEAEGEAEPEPEPDNASRGVQKRIDKLRERERDALTKAAAAEARAAAAEALLAAARGEVEPDAEKPAPKTSSDRVYTKAELEAETQRAASELVARNTFNQKCNDVAESGSKEFGAKFGASIDALKDVGLISDDPQDVAFLSDVLDTDAPAKVLHHLGQNPDEAERIAGLSATRRAVALDRLAVQLAEVKPKPKPLSKVPAPIAPVGSARGAKEIDINDPTLTDEEAIAAWEAHDRRLAAGR